MCILCNVSKIDMFRSVTLCNEFRSFYSIAVVCLHNCILALTISNVGFCQF